MCVYTNSNKILYFRLPYVKLQNSIVLQLNLGKNNPTSVVQTIQLRFNVRNTSSTFLHRYYYTSSCVHSWELNRPQTALRVCIYTRWPADSLQVENKNVGTKRNPYRRKPQKCYRTFRRMQQYLTGQERFRGLRNSKVH